MALATVENAVLPKRERRYHCWKQRHRTLGELRVVVILLRIRASSFERPAGRVLARAFAVRALLIRLGAVNRHATRSALDSVGTDVDAHDVVAACRNAVPSLRVEVVGHQIGPIFLAPVELESSLLKTATNVGHGASLFYPVNHHYPFLGTSSTARRSSITLCEPEVSAIHTAQC